MLRKKAAPTCDCNGTHNSKRISVATCDNTYITTIDSAYDNAHNSRYRGKNGNDYEY